jgi:hypothetical protein
VPLSVGTAITAGASYALIPRFGRKVLQAGLLVVVVALVGLAATVSAAGAGVTTWQLLPAMFVFGLGLGFVFGPFFNVVLAGVGEHEVGSASGTLNAIQQRATRSASRRWRRSSSRCSMTATRHRRR